MTYTSSGNVCDWARYNDTPCDQKPHFQVTTEAGDVYRFCQNDLTRALVYMSEGAPLVVEPVFGNWPAYSIAQANANAAAEYAKTMAESTST